MKYLTKTSIAIIASTLILSGCAPMQGVNSPSQNQNISKTQTGALIGAALGALIGASTKGHHKLKRAAIGAAAGAALGGAIGYNLDKQASQMAKALDTDVSTSPDAELDKTKDIIVRKTDNYVKIMFRDRMMFPTNSDRLTPTARMKIEKLIPILRQYPQTIIQVVGHTDSRGSWEYNKDLSRRRAKRVGNILYESGIPNQIFAKGCSYDKPLVPNTSPENMALNRRVEIYLYPNENAVIDPCR